MYYEINVALHGKHYFATAERSIRDIDKCREVYLALKKAFPATDGYTLNISQCKHVSAELPTTFWDAAANGDAQ